MRKDKLIALGVALLIAVIPWVLGALIALGGRYKKVEFLLKGLKQYLERRNLWI